MKIRIIIWVVLWQVYTPVQPFITDFPQMMVGFALCEVIWIEVCRLTLKGWAEND